MSKLAEQMRREIEQKNSAWVNLVKPFSKPEDKGIGDTVQRHLAMLGGERFKQWVKELGIPCRCADRQAEWNERWPY